MGMSPPPGEGADSIHGPPAAYAENRGAPSTWAAEWFGREAWKTKARRIQTGKKARKNTEPGQRTYARRGSTLCLERI